MVDQEEESLALLLDKIELIFPMTASGRLEGFDTVSWLSGAVNSDVKSNYWL